MMLTGLLLAGFMTLAQVGPVSPDGCVLPGAQGTNAATVEFCLGEGESSRANAAQDDSPERRGSLETAARHYRRSADLAGADLKQRALEALAAVYDDAHLGDAGNREVVLQELIVLVPTEPRFAFELAASQEGRDLIEIAEGTLLTARQRHPTEETYRELAQFYARRVTALHAAAEQAPAERTGPGQPDQTGVFHVGADLPPPSRLGVAQYPEDAQNAGIDGAVQAEIVINEEGAVTEAQVVRSVPFLDEAALEAVRQWRFDPTVVDGKPVPVRMRVTVNFSLSQ